LPPEEYFKRPMFKKLLLNIEIRSSKYKLKFVLIMTVFNYIKIKIITKKTQNGVY